MEMSKSRKRKLESDGDDQLIMADCEQDDIFSDKDINEVKIMWEFPQIFHFLYLMKETLKIPHLSMYEMERMLMIPRASKQLANIMTSLLSSPMTKAKLRKIPPMPYEFWTNILAHKMESWFKVYETKHRDPIKVLESIGVEPEFWNLFPDAPLLNGKDFEELPLRQKVWLLKTTCDTAMHSRKSVQEEIIFIRTNQPYEDQLETVLGTDRYGARYVYFPQFLKSDLRVYRYYLDNKTLPTKPSKPKSKIKPKPQATDDLMKKKARSRRRRSRWSNGVTRKSRRRTGKSDEKQTSDSKCNSDSAVGSLMSEDTNPSSPSVCSNNNNNTSDSIDTKRSRSLSKSSEISIESDKTWCNRTKSSGYDTNSSAQVISDKKSTQKMFKGFGNDHNNRCNVEILSKLLKAESRKKRTDKINISLNEVELDERKEQYFDTTNQHGGKDCHVLGTTLSRQDLIDKTIDNFCSISKTDDEKLNEIIMNDKSSGDVHTVQKTQINGKCINSKSDDEKLNESRTAVEKDDADVERNVMFAKRQKLDDESVQLKAKGSETESADEISLEEMRSISQREAMDDELSSDEDNEEVRYNLRNVKQNEKEVGTKNFTKLLADLSNTKFELVADSVKSLKNLITSFKERIINSTSDTDNQAEILPTCEVQLINELIQLLTTVEEMEPVLRDSKNKARAKLRKEWTNFKNGSAEDQDSSGEGLGSNWWILGPQGGDTTLQTLPQSTISAAGSQDNCDKNETETDQSQNTTERSEDVNRERKESQNVSSQREAQGSEGNSKKSQRSEEEKEDQSDEEQQNRRVLRARGISSYTEQLYSDDEIEENELEEWTDVEAVYAAPSAQTSSSSTHLPKVKHAEDRSDEEDSDQDWILPGSRKRKNKRPSANRRLKSFQHKLQSIKVEAIQDAAVWKVVSPPQNARTEKEKPKITEIRICKPGEQPLNTKASINKTVTVQNQEASSDKSSTVQNQEAVIENNRNETVPSAGMKIENVVSLHSELDIKDEGPIYDSVSNQPDNSCALNPSYVNYYVMQPNAAAIVPQTTVMQPVVSNIVSPIQQRYYVQGGQNYIIQSPPTSFVPTQPLQPQGPQMIAPQQFVGTANYVPYVVTQPQTNYITTNQQIVSSSTSQNPTFPVHPNSTPIATSQKSKRFVLYQPKHPPGAVIRSSMPIRGAPRGAYNHGPTRNVQRQGATPVRMPKPKKSSTPSENTGRKTTSLIVLSDSDDEIEMIITEKTGTEAEKASSRNQTAQLQQNSTETPNATTSLPKIAIPPQIIQRMNQGGISITPIKPIQPIPSSSTQLVVVVNDTGSHYALALPNGSKLILTPEQVAQIRASNGGKLLL